MAGGLFYGVILERSTFTQIPPSAKSLAAAAGDTPGPGGRDHGPGWPAVLCSGMMQTDSSASVLEKAAIMFPDHVFEEREELSEKIATAPLDYLQDNSAALLRIVWELQRSLTLELEIIQGIRNLNVAHAQAVESYLANFSNYVERRDYNLERTSCHRIANSYWAQIRVLEDGMGGARRVTELDDLLQRFAEADRTFTEDIEPFMKRALETLTRIRDAASGGKTDEAKAQQRQFTEEYRAEVQRLKATITSMTQVGESLLARL